ncbi:MAG: hypothetical protein J2P21_27785 [Chloracidobacterium sp.]|nr:hypothetical protein [Chloracidobacterium sp.]
MIQKNLSKPSIDPREVIERDGANALADLLAGSGYIIQRRALIDLKHALRSRKPLLIEGRAAAPRPRWRNLWHWDATLRAFISRAWTT